MERVGVFHSEFTRTHHAKTWTNLITELILDLEKGNRQLLITAQLTLSKVSDDFFVRRTQDKIAVMTVFEA